MKLISEEISQAEYIEKKKTEERLQNPWCILTIRHQE